MEDTSSTTELHTVRFLRREGQEALTQKFGLLSSCHGAHPNLVLFKYDQVRTAPYPPFIIIFILLLKSFIIIIIIIIIK